MMVANAPHPPGMTRNWQLECTTPGVKTVLSRAWRSLMHTAQGPLWQCIKPITPAPRWIGYFIFAPEGKLLDHHRFTLARLRQHEAQLAIICAAPGIKAVPDDLNDYADALYWKDLPGFDFSAYAVLVGETARQAPGADLIIMNDSVLGPFGNLNTVFDRAPWNMAGLTGYSLIENHIQSYAFRLRSVDETVGEAMAKIAGERRAYNQFQDVIYCQETRFARVMAEQRDAGVLWFSNHREGGGDLPLVWPLGLIEEGFPFLKRSLFTKFRHLADQETLNAFLKAAGHPLQ